MPEVLLKHTQTPHLLCDGGAPPDSFLPPIKPITHTHTHTLICNGVTARKICHLKCQTQSEVHISTRPIVSLGATLPLVLLPPRSSCLLLFLLHPSSPSPPKNFLSAQHVQTDSAARTSVRPLLHLAVCLIPRALN